MASKKSIKKKKSGKVHKKNNSAKVQSAVAAPTPISTAPIQENTAPAISPTTDEKKEDNAQKDRRYHKIMSAVGHVAELALITLAIIVICNEIFRGSDIGNIFILAFIAAYVIFSFAKRYWIENDSKKMMEIIDMTLMIAGGLVLMILVEYGNAFTRTDASGAALASVMFSELKTQPHVMVFYLGMLLLIVGVIRVYMMNKDRIHHRLAK